MVQAQVVVQHRERARGEAECRHDLVTTAEGIKDRIKRRTVDRRWLRPSEAVTGTGYDDPRVTAWHHVAGGIGDIDAPCRIGRDGRICVRSERSRGGPFIERCKRADLDGS